MRMKYNRIYIVATILYAYNIFAPNLYRTACGWQESSNDYSIKIGVEEIRIDAVVLNKQQKQVTDLDVDDFQLFQDGKLQNINSCIYIEKTTQSDPKASAVAETNNEGKSFIKSIGRTLAFVIDDNAMNFDDFVFTKTALKQYINLHMQPDDMATFIMSGGGIGEYQQFISNKAQLLARVNRLSCAESGCGLVMTPPWMIGSFGQMIILDASMSERERKYYEAGLNDPRQFLKSTARGADDYGYRQRLDRRMAILRYAIRALRDMPGRKALIFMSSEIDYDKTRAPQLDIENILNRISDEALRAEVVVHTLDTRGLTVWTKTKALEAYIPLSKKTGGIIIENRNVFNNVLEPINEMLKGFYLLTYTPPENTFKSLSNNRYHRIKLKAKKPGITVHTRDGFFDNKNTSDPIENLQDNPLRQAMYSPFLNNDISIKLTCGYIKNYKSGISINSWLHFKGSDLQFNEYKKDNYSISIELETMTVDLNGFIGSSKHMQYDARFTRDEYAYIRNEGLNIYTSLIVEKGGDYYFHAAARDVASGKIGTSYRFVEIPNINRGRLALSSIFVANNYNNLQPIIDGNISEMNNNSIRIGNIRLFRPGDNIVYGAVIYNGSRKTKIPSKLESQYIIYHDGKEFVKGNIEAVDISNSSDNNDIQIKKTIDINNSYKEGSYILQLKVCDKQAADIFETAIQSIDFEIEE